MTARRKPRQAERLTSQMYHHHERQARLRELLDQVRHDYRQCHEAGYLQGKTGEGDGGRSSDPSDPTGELGSSDRRSSEAPAVLNAQLKDDAARSMRAADKHMEDAITSATKAVKVLSRPFRKPGDWSSMKLAPGYGITARAEEIEDARRRQRERLARGEE